MQLISFRRGKLRSLVVSCLWGLVGTLSTLACSSSVALETSDGLSIGKSIYLEPLESGNSFACATCHALSEPASDGLIRPGHPIADAPLRTSFKNGKLDTFLAATNSCLSEWMTVPKPWSESSPEFQALEEFLVNSSGDEPVSMIEYQVVAPPQRSALLAGDPTAGRTLFNQSCSVCHGTDGEGSIRAPKVTNFALDIELVAERIRLSGARESGIYDGLTGGRMPFWSAERLSDPQVADLATYLAMSLAEPVVEDAVEEEPVPEPVQPVQPVQPVDEKNEDLVGTPAEPPKLPAVRTCSSTHPRVGATLELLNFAHDIGGSVTVVDDCTLRFTEFSFDGRGINVQIYGGLEGNYSAGFSMTGDLKRGQGYEGASFEINLPDSKSLDDLDGVSIWCVPVGADFGSGRF